MALDTAKATVILRDLTAKFDSAAAAANPFYPSICTIAPSDGQDEKYGWLGGMPGTREWLGDRHFNELRAANYTLVNKTWENSLLISKENLEDDRMNMYGPLLQDLASEATHHPDDLLFTTIVAGESTACFDTQFFYDTDHSWGDSGTQDNDLTASATDTANVTAAEFKTAFHAARRTMMEYKNDQGKLLNRPTVTGLGDLQVLVPPELEVPAHEAIRSTLLGGGDTNIVMEQNDIQIVVSPYLTSATKWYLNHTGGAMKPFVFQARRPLARQMKGLTDEETKDVKFMTSARYNVGYLAWWKSVLTTFT
tara:strand:+ start:7600 stop:8526 length:927 start_codon:yes stop_codon:yes gene_type:complete